jgi:hypothetical protein
MDQITTEFDFFQNDGADETLRQATREWEGRNPGRRAVEVSFVAAYPGRPGEGRWVTLQVKHTLDRSYACAD